VKVRAFSRFNLCGARAALPAAAGLGQIHADLGEVPSARHKSEQAVGCRTSSARRERVTSDCARRRFGPWHGREEMMFDMVFRPRGRKR